MLTVADSAGGAPPADSATVRPTPRQSLKGLSIYPPASLHSACRADFIVAQGNALGPEIVVGCALNGHFNLLRSNKLRRAFSAQLIWS